MNRLIATLVQDEGTDKNANEDIQNPYATKKVKGGFRVMSPGRTHAKKTTKEKAERQVRLLRGIEHGMIPRKRK